MIGKAKTIKITYYRSCSDVALHRAHVRVIYFLSTSCTEVKTRETTETYYVTMLPNSTGRIRHPSNVFIVDVKIHRNENAEAKIIKTCRETLASESRIQFFKYTEGNSKRPKDLKIFFSRFGKLTQKSGVKNERKQPQV